MNLIPKSRPGDASSGVLGSRAAAVALVVLAAVVFASVSVRSLSRSELRYVEAGVEMAAGGDWVVPHLSYVPYFEKPILTYWLEAASQLAFGTGMIAVRLPSILACVAMTWATYALGRSLRGPAFGIGAAALLASCAMFQEMGTAVLTDGPFAAFLAVAWYAFWRHDRAPKSGWIWVFWTALGFAVLTKGPLGVALVGSTVGAYLLLAGRFRDCRSMRFVRGTAVVVAVNLPWSVLVWQRDPRFLQFFYVRQNLQALVDERVNHAGPPWYYLQFVLPGLFPFAVLGGWALCAGVWSGLAPAVRRLLGRGDRAPPDERGLYLACMFAAPLLLLSVSASKLGTYVLPLFPAMALIAASYVDDHLAKPTRMLRWGTLVQAAVFAAIAAAVPAVAERFPEIVASAWREHSAPLTAAALLMLVPMLAGGVAMARGRIVAGMCVVGAGSFACVLAVNEVAPHFGAEAEALELVTRLNAARTPAERVIVAGACSDDYAIVRTLGRRPVLWGKTSELGMGHFTEVTPPSTPIPGDVYKIGDDQHPLPQNEWLIDNRSFRGEWKGPARMWFIGRLKDVEWLSENGFAVHPFVQKGDTAVVTNRPLP